MAAHPAENSIGMYAGTIASIPAGWNLCDGTNSTPDLRNRFVRGSAASVEAGNTGGAIDHNHTEQSTGAHTHASSALGAHGHTTGLAGSHRHGFDTGGFAGTGHHQATGTYAGEHNHTVNNSTTHSHTLDSQGAHTHTINNATDSRPPYFDVLFIQATSSAEVFTGLIIIWSGTRGDIPTGWLEKTEIREKYIRGAAASANGGGTGGSSTHNHTTVDCSGHTHGTDNQGNHTHTFAAYSVAHSHGDKQDEVLTNTRQKSATNNFVHTHATSDSIGGHVHTFQSGGVHNHGTTSNAANDPAYVKVIFIKCDSATDIPLGGIMLWVGTLATIPAAYNLCDGGSGRPDYRSKFLLGAASGVEPGATGGSDTHTHTDTAAGIHSDHTQDAYSIAHQHAATDSIGAHQHGVWTDLRASGGGTCTVDTSDGAHSHAYTNDAWSHTHITTANASNHQHTIDNGDTRPPYFDIQFIYRSVTINNAVKTITEIMGGVDSKLRYKCFYRIKVDKMGAKDSIINPISKLSRIFTEKLGALDSRLRKMSFIREFTEKLGGKDSMFVPVRDLYKEFTEVMGATHSWLKTKVIFRTFIERSGFYVKVLGYMHRTASKWKRFERPKQSVEDET